MKILTFILLFFVAGQVNAQQFVKDTSFSTSNFSPLYFHIVDTSVVYGQTWDGFFNQTFLYKRNNAGIWTRLSTLGIDGRTINVWGVDSNNVWLTSATKLFYSTNSGVNWENKLTVPSGGFINGLMFSKENPDIGYFLCDPPTGFGNRALIYSTRDAGKSWDTVSIDLGPNHRGLQFSGCIANNNYIYFGLTGFLWPNVTFIPRILYTTNGGNNWNISTLPASIHSVIQVQFKSNGKTGLATLFSDSTNIFKTTNSGTTWTKVATFANGPFGLEWIDNSDIWYVNLDTIVYKSSNDGINWTKFLGTENYHTIYDIKFKRSGSRYMGYFMVFNDVSFNYEIIRYTDTITTTNISNVSSEIPDGYELKQNYPNPFNPETKIDFSLPVNGFVELVIYDINGREIKRISETKTAGKYSYSFNAKDLPSGVYFYTLSSNNFRDSKKMILLK
ncbi:MAG TPA: T9SS type A sorting domain-containing protein [Ignavibacteria bacterium]|nr:T9SS type A sorting domain-containing protein [Ignavibacteria bacterium]